MGQFENGAVAASPEEDLSLGPIEAAAAVTVASTQRRYQPTRHHHHRHRCTEQGERDKPEAADESRVEDDAFSNQVFIAMVVGL